MFERSNSFPKNADVFAHR